MKSTYTIFLLISLTMVLQMACEPKTSSKSVVKQTNTEVTETKSTVAYTSLPSPTFQNLLQRCDYVDVIFNDVDVSMNQSNSSDVKALLSFITYGDIELPQCSESAYINFQSNGEILAEGNLYLRGKCHYIVWLVDNKPQHGNAINESGMIFFKKVLGAGTSTVTQ